ncbi:MAG: hypothetical protein GF346_12370 [Candidatus Eisenbacteria bacterium]|nr:hypothetical protein [Candidatus Latescibacterota bacterium]MBD3303231.1 hypothetical protein [Candidatus Eisenbacteria bacterium]
MQTVATARATIALTFYLALILAVTLMLPRVSSADGASAHEGIACGGCHGSGDAAVQRTSTTSDPADVCRDCHDVQSAMPVRTMQVFHRDPERSCTDCHSFHRPERITAGGRRFAHVFGDARVADHCATCHENAATPAGLSVGHVAASAFYHDDSRALGRLTPSDACLACHSNRGSARETDFDGPAPPRFNKHASHPYGVRVVLGAGDRFNHIRDRLDPRIRLLDGKIECQTCHDLFSDENDRLVQFETKYELCRGCHVHEASRPEAVLAALR